MITDTPALALCDLATPDHVVTQVLLFVLSFQPLSNLLHPVYILLFPKHKLFYLCWCTLYVPSSKVHYPFRLLKSLYNSIRVPRLVFRFLISLCFMNARESWLDASALLFCPGLGPAMIATELVQLVVIRTTNTKWAL